MMDDFYNVKRLALVLSVQAEIEGMKADNANRLTRDESMAYTESDFSSKANELQNLAYCHNEEL